MRTYYWISDLLNFATTISVGVLVLSKDAHNKLHRTFAFFCGSIAFWAFSHMLWQLVDDSSIVLVRSLMLGAIWVPTAFFHYNMVLLEKENEYKWMIRLSYILSGLFSAFNIGTNYFVARLEPRLNLGSWPVPGVFFHFHLAMFLALLVVTYLLLIPEIKRTSGVRQMQLKYCFVASLIAYAGGLPNYLPCYNILIPPWTNILISVYVVIIAYAIVKHHLMDITIIIRKTIVYSLVTSILTAIVVFLATVLMRLSENSFGHQTLFTSALAACIIAAIFHPLQIRVQAFVDKHFFQCWQDREVVREVAAGFSHELKSPLAGLSMQAQLAMAELQEVEDGRRAWIEALPKIKHELQHLINKTMDMARRIEAVRGVAEPVAAQIEPVDVSGVLDRSLCAVQAALSETRISVHHCLQADLPLVKSNARQLEIVFINLIKNALDAMEGDDHPHELSLTGTQHSGSVLVSFKDTGSGIANKDIDRIFEPNFTTKGRRGMGMGLYLTQQIVKAHNGAIEVKSEEGKGAEFIVRLPKYAETGVAFAS